MGHRQPTVLCIDDDPEGLKIRRLLLESMGYKVWTEPDAEHGLRAFRNHDVDAVLMDYEMPGMTGGEAAAEMKRVRPDVPVLILSALPWLPEGAPAEAIDGFIQKGEPLTVLSAMLDRVIARHEEVRQERKPVGRALSGFFEHIAGAIRKKATAH